MDFIHRRGESKREKYRTFISFTNRVREPGAGFSIVSIKYSITVFPLRPGHDSGSASRVGFYQTIRGINTARARAVKQTEVPSEPDAEGSRIQNTRVAILKSRDVTREQVRRDTCGPDQARY